MVIPNTIVEYLKTEPPGKICYILALVVKYYCVTLTIEHNKYTTSSYQHNGTCDLIRALGRIIECVNYAKWINKAAVPKCHVEYSSCFVVMSFMKSCYWNCVMHAGWPLPAVSSRQ